eukprot:m.582452 g.582452  ORF g.582452 m.582452 type:complete len:347 (+) comp22337_c1_seq9:688-1728(+)
MCVRACVCILPIVCIGDPTTSVVTAAHVMPTLSGMCRCISWTSTIYCIPCTTSRINQYYRVGQRFKGCTRTREWDVCGSVGDCSLTCLERTVVPDELRVLECVGVDVPVEHGPAHAGGSAAEGVDGREPEPPRRPLRAIVPTIAHQSVDDKRCNRWSGIHHHTHMVYARVPQCGCTRGVSFQGAPNGVGDTSALRIRDVQHDRAVGTKEQRHAHARPLVQPSVHQHIPCHLAGVCRCLEEHVNCEALSWHRPRTDGGEWYWCGQRTPGVPTQRRSSAVGHLNAHTHPNTHNHMHMVASPNHPRVTCNPVAHPWVRMWAGKCLTHTTTRPLSCATRKSQTLHTAKRL